ncbi:MAG TPA: metallophosphoesterase family protein [Deltaproteobacteria bacterium]|nr:metallophosphoesterase family protein [Deltaproteobacteria bacterium]HQI82491.1 metallophosphoesterase family protein [Deltaproteobacteria bacterium]
MDTAGPIGLIADSHGRTDLMVRAILMLRDMGAREIIHLGDICDSLAPLALEDAVGVLREHGVQALRGNNEYAVWVNHRGERADLLPEGVLSYLEGLPYTITRGDIRFAHSAPFDWPAATSWPITDNHPLIDLAGIIDCRILFRGHSHTPSVVELDGKAMNRIAAPAGSRMRFRGDRRYVVTVGAVEDELLALFLPEDDEVRFLRLDA